MICCQPLPMCFLDWSHAIRLTASGLVFLALGVSPAVAQVPNVDQDDELFGPSTRFTIAQGSGARALGMGGAFIARPDDATAASWNPAGLSYLRKIECSVAGLLTSGHSIGRALIEGTTQVGSELAADYRLKSMTPDFVSVAVPFEGDVVNGAYQLSFQRAIPFDGERRIHRSRRRLIELDTKGGFDVLAVGIGLQLSKSFRLGATVNRWVNGYQANFAKRSEAAPDPNEIEIRESDLSLDAWNMNAGVIWHPLGDDRLNVGLVGKTPFDAKVSLWKRRKDFAPGLELELREKREFHSGLSLRFPAVVGVGASWRIASPLTASLDYTHSFWSDASITGYFQLPVRGQSTALPRLPFPDITSKTGQADTQQLRAGIEYVFFVGQAKCPLRVGYFNDRQYFFSDNPATRDVEDDGGAPRFHAFTGGAGLAAGNFLFDVAYVRERGRYFEGLEYSATTHRVFASVIFRYGSRY